MKNRTRFLRLWAREERKTALPLTDKEKRLPANLRLLETASTANKERKK